MSGRGADRSNYARFFCDDRFLYNEQTVRLPVDDKRRILLIEDNEADIFLIERALAATLRPLETQCFRNGAEALAVLLASEEASLPHLILLDLNMPRYDGLDILRRIRSSPKLNAIPVGILTGSVAASDRQLASTIGATRYIHKDSRYDAFVSNVGNAVKAMLDGSALKPPPTEAFSVAPHSRPQVKGKSA